MGGINPAAFLCLVILTSVDGTERSGRLTDTDLADVEDLLNSVSGEVRRIEIPPPPLSDSPHRDKRILCRLGDSTYCPGELLFRMKCELGTKYVLPILYFYLLLTR